MKYFIRIAGILLIICAVTALLVAGVNAITKDKIEENNMKKIMCIYLYITESPCCTSDTNTEL